MASHAVALGWVVCSGPVLAVPLRDRPAAAIARPPTDAAAAEPLSVVLLDPRADAPAHDATTAPIQPRAASATPERHRPPAGSAAISTGATGVTSAAASGEPTHAEPGPSPWLTMRGPERPPTAGLSSGFIERFLDNSKPLAPAPDIPGERIADELADTRRQLRHAEQIGSSQVGALRWRILELNKQRAAEELRPSGRGTFAADKPTFTAKVDADGRIHLEDKPGALDTQDRMMLGRGIDPYAHNKLALLDRTRDQRAAIGERHQRVQLARSAELMQRNVDRLWAMARELAARKRGLFELWDDCAEAGSDDQVAGGAAARELVLGAIRARLRGGDAYTPAELVELNARRRSKAAFAPYE